MNNLQEPPLEVEESSAAVNQIGEIEVNPSLDQPSVIQNKIELSNADYNDSQIQIFNPLAAKDTVELMGADEEELDPLEQALKGQRIQNKPKKKKSKSRET